MRTITLQQAFLDFQDALTSNPVGAEAQALYLRLLYYANAARYKVNGEWVFRKWVEVPSKRLLQETGIPRKTMYKLRDELAQAGYIRFKSGIGNGVTEYMLRLLHEANRNQPKPTEANRSQPKQEAPSQGSFCTDDFYNAAVRASLGDDC